MGIYMNGRLIFLNEKACHTHKGEGKALNVIAIRKKSSFSEYQLGFGASADKTYKKELGLAIPPV